MRRQLSTESSHAERQPTGILCRARRLAPKNSQYFQVGETLEHALRQGDLVVSLQPSVDVEGRHVGAEATRLT